MTTPPRPWWHTDRHADRRPTLSTRMRIKNRLRVYFEGEGFQEVECGLLQISPGNEAHLHAFATELQESSGRKARLYLHTSPEFASKKLLAAGERRIFDFARVFRNRDRSRLHAFEFTMLEWYRAGEPYEAVMRDTVAALRLAAEIAGCREIVFGGASADPFAEPERLSCADAFQTHAGIDLGSTLSSNGSGNGEALALQATSAGIKCGTGESWSDIFSRILTERVEPALGLGRPTLLDRYPVTEAALARPAADDPRFAERFELYVAGVELANGFGELTDPVEQRRRFESEMAKKERLYGERYPIDESFLAALKEMPQASGVALGFDRLVMLVTGARRIDDVLWTPIDDRL